MPSLALPLTLSLLAGCNSYEIFRVTGFEQASFSNDADILFVIDNSDSMQEEATGLASNFERFIGKLTNAETGSAVPTETLGDAVANYLRETTGDSLFIDYQLAITTSSVYYDDGPTGNIDPGEAGTLAFDAASAVPGIIGREVDNAGLAFQTNLLCKATCWDSNMPSDPTYVCEEPLEGDVSEEYLNCLCGAGNWQGNCGAGQEQPIEAAYMTLCRAAENPPDDCYLFVDGAAQAFTEGDEHSNEGFLRAGANTLVVIVTDEGDSSLRNSDGEAAVPGDVDTVVDEYVDLFSQLPNLVRFAVIGPAWDGSNGACLETAQEWGVDRLTGIVAETNGLYIPLTNLEDGCSPTDFGTSLDQLGTLLSNLLTLFPLQSVPDAGSIEVYVDGEIIERSELTSGAEEAGNAVYGTGWTYDASENSVAFHGEAVPDYNQDVRIYYRPLGGTPRELPF
ncbi:MAG: hypothetical protein Q8P18_12410 [Pseudomonadota bacterium]|nr:hypothetical protein [Pseudomonadota bacterium]